MVDDNGVELTNEERTRKYRIDIFVDIVIQCSSSNSNNVDTNKIIKLNDGNCDNNCNCGFTTVGIDIDIVVACNNFGYL